MVQPAQQVRGKKGGVERPQNGSDYHAPSWLDYTVRLEFPGWMNVCDVLLCISLRVRTIRSPLARHPSRLAILVFGRLEYHFWQRPLVSGRDLLARRDSFALCAKEQTNNKKKYNRHIFYLSRTAQNPLFKLQNTHHQFLWTPVGCRIVCSTRRRHKTRTDNSIQETSPRT